MNVDYLASGSDECPLIRLYQGSDGDYEVLSAGILNLINKNVELDVLSLNGFVKDNSIQELTIRKDAEDEGIEEVNPGRFICHFSEEHLQDILEKIEHYRKSNSGYHWLDDKSDISILLSYSGKW